LSVQDPISEPIPELDQRPEEGSKVRSFGFTRTEHTWDVFPEEVFGLELVDESENNQGKIASRVGESFSEAGDAEGLAGRSGDDEVHISS
jgi:hypothetical protein